MNSLDDLENIAANCRECDLYKRQIKPVFARGNKEADVFICGMCPGDEENRTGIPFVGAAGKILDELIFRSFSLKNKIYITNLVKCFVPAGTSLKQEWMDRCLPYLIVQLKFVNPKVIIALGKDVSNYLLNSDERMSDLRGHAYNYGKMKLISTYHPSYLARAGGVNHKHFNTVVNDFKKSLKFI